MFSRSLVFQPLKLAAVRCIASPDTGKEGLAGGSGLGMAFRRALPALLLAIAVLVNRPARADAFTPSNDARALTTTKGDSTLASTSEPNIPGGTTRTAVDDPSGRAKDSLAERGSHNFSDMGSWIWDANTYDRQTVRFWTSFEIPAGELVNRARLRVTADNEYVLYLDGKELGRDAEWRHLYEYDITALLQPGRHVLAVEAYNSSREAGFVFGMLIGLVNGQIISVKSDANWLIVPNDLDGWEKRTQPQDDWRVATIESPFGKGPWGTMDYINLVPPMEPVVVPFWRTGRFEILLMSIFAIVTVFSFSLAAQVLLSQKEKKLLVRERARIARDIHDDLGMRVTQLVLLGEVAQSELPPGGRAHGQLLRISEEARGALRAMDEILWAINPRRDTLHEFANFICTHAQKYLASSSIQCVLDVEPGLSTVAFDLPFRRNLLLAVKEALNNAAKHSGATELCLQIRRQGAGIIVVVEDNGHGFDLSQIDDSRNGLDNMTQRMHEIGGIWRLASEPGKGCRVEFIIPHIQIRRRLWWSGWLFGKKPDILSPIKDLIKK